MLVDSLRFQQPTNAKPKNVFDVKTEKWRKKWLSSINELTSLNLQMKSWLNDQNKNPHWSYVEFRCTYFDDLFLDENCLKLSWISDHEFNILKDWHKNLREYEAPKNNVYDHQAILKDSKWLDIVELGRKITNLLTNILTPNEEIILNQEKTSHTRHRLYPARKQK